MALIYTPFMAFLYPLYSSLLYGFIIPPLWSYFIPSMFLLLLPGLSKIFILCTTQEKTYNSFLKLDYFLVPQNTGKPLYFINSEFFI